MCVIIIFFSTIPLDKTFHSTVKPEFHILAAYFLFLFPILTLLHFSCAIVNLKCKSLKPSLSWLCEFSSGIGKAHSRCWYLFPDIWVLTGKMELCRFMCLIPGQEWLGHWHWEYWPQHLYEHFLHGLVFSWLGVVDFLWWLRAPDARFSYWHIKHKNMAFLGPARWRSG